ncbi:sigma-70 family RNA polymerase sigma factor, partial [Terribacillus saccharophilus]|uniref:sigma-70 family RNA polymerase sigma factor n=1 Tax=Terribacillus saccharophilus TaxID=361277 RepID=UPI00118002CA
MAINKGGNSIIRLIKKAQKGDDRAFLKLFQQYQDDIYRIAFTYVKNQNDALDVVQETAYRSFKNIDSLRNSEYFKTWLIKITINCSIELVRKNKKVIQLKPEYEEYVGLIDED